MFYKSLAVTAWGMLAFIVYATISPVQDRPTLPTSSAFEHSIAFAVLGILFCLAYSRRVILVWLVVLGSAVTLELLQFFTPDRHGRVRDAIEKMAGGAFGILAARAMLYFKQANRWFAN